MSDTNPPAKKFTVTLRRTQVQTVTFVLENYNDNPPLNGIAQGYCWPSKWEDEGDPTVAHTDAHVVTIIDREANPNYDTPNKIVADGIKATRLDEDGDPIEAPDQGRIDPALSDEDGVTEVVPSMVDPNEPPHSRACGISPHPHGSMCHKNCPTCHGSNAWNK